MKVSFLHFDTKLFFWNDDTDPKNLLKQYLTPYKLPDTVKQHGVDRDCTLQDYITKTLSLEFRDDYIYCELTNGVENILEDKEVLLQDKNDTKTWFRLVLPEQVAAAEKLKLYGEGIAHSNFGEQYRVFIQNSGSGARHLSRGSTILYNHYDEVCNQSYYAYSIIIIIAVTVHDRSSPISPTNYNCYSS